MELENQSAINPRHKSSPIKPNQPSIAWIKFITPSSSFGLSLECPAFELAQISWISPLSASLIFLDLALVIGPTGTCNGSLNACWFSSHLAIKKCQDCDKKQLKSSIDKPSVERCWGSIEVALKRFFKKGKTLIWMQSSMQHNQGSKQYFKLSKHLSATILSTMIPKTHSHTKQI